MRAVDVKVVDTYIAISFCVKYTILLLVVHLLAVGSGNYRKEEQNAFPGGGNPHVVPTQ